MEFEDNGTRGDSQEWSSDQSHYQGDQLGTLDQFHQPNTKGLPSASETTTVTAGNAFNRFSTLNDAMFLVMILIFNFFCKIDI